MQSEDKKPIENIHDLRSRLKTLEKIRNEQEHVLTKNFKEVYATLQPRELINNAMDILKQEEDNLSQIGNYGIRFLSQKYLSGQTTTKGMLKGIVATELIFLTYNKFQKQIHNGIVSATRKFSSFLGAKRTHKD